MDKIQRLRSLAELNFCQRCFELYKALIEGSIKTLLAKPLNDWAWIEYQITQMVMKTEGVFKTNEIIIPDRNEVEKYANQIDVKKFKEINGTWSFKRKIDYLHQKGIIQDSSFELLDKARCSRNKIHREPILTEFTEEDYSLFSIANTVVSQLYTPTLFEGDEEFNSALKINAEKIAELFLAQVNQKSQVS